MSSRSQSSPTLFGDSTSLVSAKPSVTGQLVYEHQGILLSPLTILLEAGITRHCI